MSEPHQKVKVITFNTKSHLEKYLLDYANNLKKDQQSFSGLMKHLLIAYIVSIGGNPPGITTNRISNLEVSNQPTPKIKNKSMQKAKKGIGFSYDEEED